jgi:hypothetical protein
MMHGQITQSFKGIFVVMFAVSPGLSGASHCLWSGQSLMFPLWLL